MASWPWHAPWSQADGILASQSERDKERDLKARTEEEVPGKLGEPQLC